MTVFFQQFEVDSSLELVADHWSVRYVGSEPFRTATPTDVVTIRQGLLDANSVEQLITFIDQGKTDEFEITLSAEAITGAKRGRDPAARALDYQFKKRYVRLPETPVVQQVTLAGVPDMAEVKGVFTAKQIATEAVESAGLTLAWGCPDYTLAQTFVASGRIIDTVRRLVAPWTWVEPFKADLFMQGKTLIVQQRNAKGLAAQLADLSISAEELRRTGATLRRRRTRKYGTVILRGKTTSETVQNPDPTKTGIGELFIEGNQEEHDVSETFAPDGSVLSRVTTDSTYRMPSHILIDQVKETYTRTDDGGLLLSSREIIHNEWEPVAISTAGPTSQQKQVSSMATTEGFDDENVFRTTQTSETGFAYDDDGFQTGSTQRTKVFNPDTNLLEDSQEVVKTMREVASLIQEQVSEVLAFQEVDTPPAGTVKRWVRQSRDVQQSGGHKPGGPNRGRPLKVGSDGRSPGGGTQIFLAATISGDPDAVDVEESNENLDAAALAAIMAQFQAASDLWEFELMAQGPAMPFVNRGQYLQITGMPSEVAGVAIQLPVMIVTEVKSTYDESAQEARSTMQVRAFGWQA